MLVEEVVSVQRYLIEMPFLMTGNGVPASVEPERDCALAKVCGFWTLDFGLSDPQTNKQRLVRFMANNPTTLRQDGRGTLYHNHTRLGGTFFFVSKVSGLIEYYMQYSDTTRADLKSCATQIEVWNRRGPPGITSEIFFDHMLKTFKTMISDKAQTDAGKMFWERMLVEGIGRGFRVGMLEGSKTNDYDPATNFDQWKSGLNGWGKTRAHYRKLFFITSVPKPATAEPAALVT